MSAVAAGGAAEKVYASLTEHSLFLQKSVVVCKVLVMSHCTYQLSFSQEGVKVGQQVLAVSDPVNESQLLSLREKPSKMALMRAINNRRYPEVELSFTPNVASVAQGIIDNAGGQAPVLHTLPS